MTSHGSLCLTLRLDDSITVGDTLVTVVRLKNKELRLVIRAPKSVKISRVAQMKNKLVTSVTEKEIVNT